MKLCRSVSTEDFAAIEQIVNKIIAEKQPFERLVLLKEDALELFKVYPLEDNFYLNNTI
jgi:threonyl-tRNA synthetase